MKKKTKNSPCSRAIHERTLNLRNFKIVRSKPCVVKQYERVESLGGQKTACLRFGEGLKPTLLLPPEITLEFKHIRESR